MIGLIQEAAERKAQSLQWERKRKEEEERQRLAEEAEKRRQVELKRIARLEKDAEDWEKSQRIGAYLEAVEQLLNQRASPATSEELGAWLRWASRYVERLDPLTRIAARMAESDGNDKT